MCLALAVASEPAVFRKRRVAVAKTVLRSRARAAGVLPFRLAGQTKTVTLHPVIEIREETLGRVPTHLFHGQIRALVVRGIGHHHRLPLFLGHFVFPEVEWPRD